MSNKQLDMFEDPDAVDQIKLASLTVYNWGSFNGLHTININPDGTLITGENGAGKSTIIDGLMVLLCSAGRVSFNMAAAQGDKTDRSLVSYMRGSYGRSEDENGATSKNLRNNTVVTIIKATYKHTANDRIAVLMGVFYINGNSNQLSDVKKLYIISETDISVKEMLQHFTNNDTHSLKSYLKTINRCEICDDNFKEYEAHYKTLLRIENSNAAALLSRALGLKKIDDLTDLIRKLVLEPGEIKQDAIATVKQFEDLKITHQRLMDARSQEAQLIPIRENKLAMEEADSEAARYDESNRHLECFTAGYAIEHYEFEQKKKINELEIQENKAHEYENKKKELEAYQDTCHENYLKQGGDAIEKIATRITDTETKLVTTRESLARYNDLASKLDLKDGSSEENFTDNYKKKGELLLKQDELENELLEEKAKITSEAKNIRTCLDEIDEQLRMLKDKPDSNVDYRYQHIRDEIADDLDLDPSELVYAAELMDVKESEQRWQGAIERALGGIRITLLVSQQFYRAITTWVNQRHTGLHMRIQVVEPNSSYNVVFGNRGFLQKLKWKKHPFTNWLQNNLLKQDLACVNSVEELNDTEFSMTVEGLIHRKGGFFEKKDQKAINDRHEWCLGFSSVEKLNLLKKDQEFYSNQLIDLQAKDLKVNQRQKNIRENGANIILINEFKQFSQIDTKTLETSLQELQEQQRMLKTSEDTLKFKEIWEKSKEQVQQIYEEIREIAQVIGGLKSEIEHNARLIEDNKALVYPLSQEATDFIIECMKELHIVISSCYEQHNKEKARDYLINKRKTCKALCDRYKQKMTTDMGKFYGTWSTQKAIDGLIENDVDTFIELLEKIQREGLPALVEEFKEKLNTEVTQSVASIKSKIDAELSDIDDRIARINEVLARAEFREKTYLRIVAKRQKYPFITDFEKDVAKVLGMITSDDHEKRYDALEKVIQVLDTAVKNNNTKDNSRLLDPRLRMFFVAQELDRETNEIKDVLDSSSGKSGGEKEAFAGSVVAAALAYVLTPNDEEAPTYCSVFLDEAFSNTSDAVSIRVLRIFKELKLHVNLITPFKNIDVARDYARSLIIMTRDINTHNSMASELTWEQYDKQLNEARSQELANLGITIEELEQQATNQGNDEQVDESVE